MRARKRSFKPAWSKPRHKRHQQGRPRASASSTWVDLDDAPELHGRWPNVLTSITATSSSVVAGRRPIIPSTRSSCASTSTWSEHFRRTGPRWQTRINDTPAPRRQAQVQAERQIGGRGSRPLAYRAARRRRAPAWHGRPLSRRGPYLLANGGRKYLRLESPEGCDAGPRPRIECLASPQAWPWTRLSWSALDLVPRL
jgi:hypothetical protein